MTEREFVLDREATEAIAGARRDLAAALDEVERLRRDHRTVETVLEGVLAYLPVPMVVVDADLRVRALSAAGEQVWRDRIGRTVTHGEAAFRAVLEGREVDVSDGGLQLVRIDEPGTGERFVMAWPAR